MTLFLSVLAVNTSSRADPDDKVKLEAALKANKPGEMHRKLEPLVGKWELTAKTFINPSNPPVQSKSTIETQWVMGGRFIRTQSTSEFAGIKGESVGFTGYDNLRETYIGAWLSTGSTSITTRAGKVDEDGKVFTFEWEQLNLITKEKFKIREVTRIVDNDTYEQTVYSKDVGQPEYKAVETIARRVKQ
jgi:hypothetical protein